MRIRNIRGLRVNLGASDEDEDEEGGCEAVAVVVSVVVGPVGRRLASSCSSRLENKDGNQADRALCVLIFAVGS